MVMNISAVRHFDYCDHNPQEIDFNHGPFFKFQVGSKDSG